MVSRYNVEPTSTPLAFVPVERRWTKREPFLPLAKAPGNVFVARQIHCTMFTNQSAGKVAAVFPANRCQTSCRTVGE